MKQITVSDEDYETLMELSKELQTQENDHQAFPYFWSPRSTKKVIGTDDDELLIYDSDDCETSTLKDLATENEELFNSFLKFEDLGIHTEYDDIDVDSWENYILNFSNDCSRYRIVYEKDEDISESNYSLFKSDVQHHINCNSYHLGRKPHTYGNTFFRMFKMEALVKCLYRLNPQEVDKINHEALTIMNIDKDTEKKDNSSKLFKKPMYIGYWWLRAKGEEEFELAKVISLNPFSANFFSGVTTSRYLWGEWKEAVVADAQPTVSAEPLTLNFNKTLPERS